MSNHLEFKTGMPNNNGVCKGIIQVEVNAANAASTLAVADTIDLCEIAAGTIIESVDEVVLTAATAAAQTAVATVTDAHTFKAAAVLGVGGAVNTALIGELSTATTFYYPAADTLRVTISANAMTGARVVYLIHYRIVNLKAKP